MLFLLPTEILTQAEQGTLVIGLVDKEFTAGKQPGSVPHSIGYHALDGRFGSFIEWKKMVRSIFRNLEPVIPGITF